MLNLFKKKEETPVDKAIRITKIAQSRIIQKHVDCILEDIYSSADSGCYTFTLFKTEQIEKYWCQISEKLLELGFKFNHIGKNSAVISWEEEHE
jgi:hypothetical protein